MTPRMRKTRSLRWAAPRWRDQMMKKILNLTATRKASGTKKKKSRVSKYRLKMTLVKIQLHNMEVSHQHENDNEHIITLWVRASKSWRTCIKVMTSSSVVSLASMRIGFHFRTFQTNIILFIFFDLWTCSPWKCNTVWLFEFFGIAISAYCPWVYAR
jgi:hypothetical protein